MKNFLEVMDILFFLSPLLPPCQFFESSLPVFFSSDAFLGLNFSGKLPKNNNKGQFGRRYEVREVFES
jgi:hypothetical protein